MARSLVKYFEGVGQNKKPKLGDAQELIGDPEGMELNARGRSCELPQGIHRSRRVRALLARARPDSWQKRPHQEKQEGFTHVFARLTKVPESAFKRLRSAIL